MCRAMEEMRNETAFRKDIEHILMLMKKLGMTKEQVLEFYEIPKADYPRYMPLLTV